MSTFKEELDKQDTIYKMHYKIKSNPIIENNKSFDKINILKEILKDCQNSSKNYKRKYKKTKRIDDMLDLTNALLSGTSISLIAVGFTIPPFLIASASLSSIAFILSRCQDKYNFKSRYTQNHLTLCQYNDLAREIRAVLSKNNLTSDQYQLFIEECYDKMSLIEDSQIF